MAATTPSHPLRWRIRKVVLPGLVWAIAFVATYSFFHWLLVLRSEWLRLDEELLKLWLPMLLPWVVIVAALRPRIHRLRWPGRDGRMSGYLAAWALLAAPTIVAQHYLESATGRLLRCASVDELSAAPAARFYEFTHFFFDRTSTRSAFSVHPTGHNNENLNLTVYQLCPVRSRPDTLARDEPAAWAMVKYPKQVSNRTSDSAKQYELRNLLEWSTDRFNELSPASVRYFKRLRAGESRLRAEEAILANTPPGTTAPLILEAHFDDWETRTGSTFAWIFGAFGIGAVLWTGLGLFSVVESRQVQEHTAGEANQSGTPDSIWEQVRPRRGFIVTPLALAAISVSFAAMALSGLKVSSIRAADLLAWGAVTHAALGAGEWWRLLTAGLLHGSLLHFANNFVGLWLCGVLLESVSGWKWFTATLLASAIAANWASAWWAPHAVTVGASGAIFGLIGFALSPLLTTGRHTAAEHRVLLPVLLAYGGINLVFGFFTPNVANAAHIFGLLTGAVLGWIAAPRREPPEAASTDHGQSHLNRGPR